jgi:thioredoxin reductase (NADPH)
MSITLYYRSGCSLCEQMLQELQPLQQRYGFQLELQDIDAHPEFQSRFNVRIPLLMAGETVLSEHFLDENRVDAHFS